MMEGLCFYFFHANSKYRVTTKGFKFHARPQTGAYSCYILKEASSSTKVLISIYMKEHRLGFPKINRDSRFDLRSPSYGAHNVADFRHFQTELSEHITDEPWPVVGDLPGYKYVYLDWYCVSWLITALASATVI